MYRCVRLGAAPRRLIGVLKYGESDSEACGAVCSRGALMLNNDRFKSCRIHRIYELNTCERHHNVKMFYKPEFPSWGRLCGKKKVCNAMDAAKDYRYAASVLTVGLLKLINY